MKQIADTIVVGAGIVGLCVARRLAQAGRRVTVLERARIGAGASGASAGILARPINVRSPFQRRCARSFDRYPAFLDELEAASGERVERLDTGMLYLPCDDAETAILRRKHDALVAQGRPARWERYGAVEREGLFIAETRRVHPPRLLVALGRALERAGGEIREFASREELDKAMRIADERVICAGAWTTEIARGLGVELEAPVVPIRGQMAEFRCPKGVVPPFMLDVGDVYIIPRPAGRIWVGATVEEVGFENRTTPKSTTFLLENARLALPFLEASDIVTTWSGLRPKAMRRGGAITHVEPGLAILAGHYRNGILLGPLEADELVERITAS